jgi:hypothetical protein
VDPLRAKLDGAKAGAAVGRVNAAADAVARLEHRDRVAARGEVGCGFEACDTRADHESVTGGGGRLLQLLLLLLLLRCRCRLPWGHQGQ